MSFHSYRSHAKSTQADVGSIVCRQMFTLDTYHNFYNRLLNHAVLVGSFAGTLVFLSTVSLVIIKTIFWAACFLVPVDPAHGMLLQWGTDNMLIQVCHSLNMLCMCFATPSWCIEHQDRQECSKLSVRSRWNTTPSLAVLNQCVS